MPQKPPKWRIKIWCLADVVSKYVHDFDIYCGARHYSLDDEVENKVEGGQGVEVVHKLMSPIANRGHLVVMDNFFSSIELFEELERKGIYATWIIQGNRIGLLAFMKN